MRDLRNLLFAVILLTFVGGVGTGAWIGSLTAATPGAPHHSVDRRVEDWNNAFLLDRSQNRHLRAVLEEYDIRRERIRNEVDAEQFRRIFALQETCRDKIRELLTDEQRARYDDMIRPLETPKRSNGDAGQPG